MSNTNGSMRLSLSARMMRALESHFSVSTDDGALILDPALLGLVGLNADGTWGDTSSVHGSTSLLDLAGKLKAATDAVQADVNQNELDGDNDRAAIRSEFAAADAVLQGNIDAVQADVDQNELDSDAAHSAATTDRGAIRSEFAAADGVLQGNIDAVQADVDQNEADSDAAHAAATTDRGAIRSEFAAADTALKSELMGDAAADFNTLGKLEDKILEEKGRAEAAEGVLQGNIDAVQADVDQNEADSDAAHAAATTDRGAIRSEFATADSAIQAELDTTQTGAGLSASGAYVADQSTNYITGATSLADADKKLDAEIKSERDRALAAEGVLQTNIDAEETRALAAESALSAAIAVEEGRIDAILAASTADADSFAEIVTLINSVDAENDQAFAGHVSNYNARVTYVDGELTDLAADIVAGDNTVRGEFAAADASIQAELDATQVGAGLGIDGTYSANVAADYIDDATSLVDADNKLDAAIKFEADRALAAEGVLQGNIDAVQADVDQNEADSDAAHSAATTDRGAIRSEFAAADGVLQGNIDAVQADVDQNELDSDAAHAAATTDRGAIRSEFAAADGVLQGNIDAVQADVDQNEADSDAAHSAATTDRGLIRSEFAAADTALKNELMGDAAPEYNTLGKIEDELQIADGERGDLNSLTTGDKASLVGAINSLRSESVDEIGSVSSEVEIRSGRYYPLVVDGDSGFVHDAAGPGSAFGTVSLEQVLAADPAVGAAFQGFKGMLSDQERADEIRIMVKNMLKVFVNGMLVPMKRDVNGDFVMSDVRDAFEFQFSADGSKVLAPAEFVVLSGEFAVMMLG